MYAAKCFGDRIIRDSVDQAYAQGFAGMNFLGPGKQSEGSRFSNETRKTLCATPSGHQSKRRPTVSKDGVRRGDAAMTGERQIESSTHAVTFDHREYWAREALDDVHQLLANPCERKASGGVERLNLSQVGPRGEKFRIAGNDKRLGIFTERDECICQRHNASTRQAIRFVSGREPHLGVRPRVDDVEVVGQQYFRRRSA